MNAQRASLGAVGIATIALVGAASAEADSLVEANVKELMAGDEVAVSRIPDGVYLRSVNDPDDVIWERLPEYRTHVAPAPPVHESVDLRMDYEDEGRDVYFTLARTSERFLSAACDGVMRRGRHCATTEQPLPRWCRRSVRPWRRGRRRSDHG